MYTKESIELRQNLVDLILNLHRGVIPEDSIIKNKDYLTSIIKDHDWVEKVIKRYVREINKTLNSRTKVVKKLHNSKDKDVNDIWLEILKRVHKELHTTQHIPTVLWKFRKVGPKGKKKIVPANEVQWVYYKEKMKLVDPATGKEIVGGLQQIKIEGKPSKIKIDNNCLKAQRKRPWIPNFERLLISP